MKTLLILLIVIFTGCTIPYNIQNVRQMYPSADIYYCPKKSGYIVFQGEQVLYVEWIPMREKPIVREYIKVSFETTKTNGK